MSRNGLTKALSGKDTGLDLSDDRAQPADIDIAGEKLQRVVDARTGAQEQGEIARERRDISRAWPREQGRSRVRSGCRAAFAGRVNQDEPEIFDAPGDLGRGRGGDRAAHQLAALRQGAVVEARHALTGSSSRAGFRLRTSRPRGTFPSRPRPWWSCQPRPRSCQSMPNRYPCRRARE